MCRRMILCGVILVRCLQVGGMGLTFYDKDMKPLDNILYQSLLSWKSQPKLIQLQMHADEADSKGGKGKEKDALITIKTTQVSLRAFGHL